MKKVYLFLILGFAAIGILVSLVNYLSTGKIIITTNNKGSLITLQRVGQGKAFTKTGLSSLSTTARHGLYTATVKNGSRISIRVIDFHKGHKTLRYSINPSGLETVEPVAYQNAKDITSSSSQMLYVDTPSGYLNKIDAQNNILPLNSAQQLQTVKWASPSFGVGQDGSGHLYTVINSSVSPLRVPFSYGTARVNFAVSSSKQIYVSYGADVYAGGQSGNLKKIYTAPYSNLVIASQANQVAIAGETEGESANSSTPLLVTISVSGKVIKKSVKGEIRRLEWSPNGNYLVSTNESFATIYDTSLSQIATVPAASPVGYIAWLDNNTFLYALNNELWSYDLSAQGADLVATMPFLANAITGLAISGDKSSAYLTSILGSANSYAVLRVGLRGQQVPGYLSKLQDILPLTLSDCSLSLVNFTQPATILVKAFPDSNLSSPQAYLQEAQNELKQDGFDINTLTFKLVSGY